jgi:hypothetical protein
MLLWKSGSLRWRIVDISPLLLSRRKVLAGHRQTVVLRCRPSACGMLSIVNIHLRPNRVSLPVQPCSIFHFEADIDADDVLTVLLLTDGNTVPMHVDSVQPADLAMACPSAQK